MFLFDLVLRLGLELGLGFRVRELFGLVRIWDLGNSLSLLKPTMIETRIRVCIHSLHE